MDCGEGTQFRLRDLKFGFSKIKVICISHLHGDHYYGLFGLLDSMALSGRKEEIYILAPEGLRNLLVEFGRTTGMPPLFPIHFISTDGVIDRVQLYSDERISIEAFPLDHGIPCTGFLFRTFPGERKMKKEKLFEGMPYDAIRKLKAGVDVFDQHGQLLYGVEDYTLEASPPLTYAYCSDTVYLPSLATQIPHVDLLYHEATFGEEFADKAQLRGHATSRQAALIAKASNAKKLLIGHFSSRYTEIEPLLKEAREIFPNTEYAQEGETYYV